MASAETPPPETLEARFSELADDALSQAQQSLGLIPRAGGSGAGRRIALAIAVTWLPLVLYAMWRRRLLPGTVPEPLLEHFGIHARFLVALPLLIVAESTARRALGEALPQFLLSGIVRREQLPAFRAILQAAIRLRSSRVALVVMLGIAVIATLIGWRGSATFHELAWDTAPEPRSVHLGIVWFCFVSRPLFLLALLAWVWRLGILGAAFARIARLELSLAPTHPDRAGGLGFLERLPIGLAPLFLAIAVPIAARWGHDAVYHGLDLDALRVPALALIALNVLIGVAPMLAFTPRLLALRRDALLRWGALLSEHGQLVERRWIAREPIADDALLAAPELGPVADTASLYETVRRIRFAPIARASLMVPLLATGIPLIAVVATRIPLGAIARKLLGGLVGA
jgi:hypothetical protein